MEILVDVIKMELEGRRGGSPSGDLVVECRVEAGDEVCTQQLPVLGPRDAARPEDPRQWPQFKLQFQSPSPSSVLSLVLFTTGSVTTPPTGSVTTPPTASVTTRIGGCTERLTFQQVDRRLEEFHKQTANQTRVGLLGTRIEGTGVDRFVGKIWFKVKHVYITPIVLLSRELEHTCHDVFPSITPTVSVIFHSVNSASGIRNGERLKPIACLGAVTSDNGHMRNFTMLQNSGTKGHSVMSTSILKAVTLACDDQPSLELHIVNTATDSIIFSTSHQLKSLTPFWHYNWQYDLKSLTSTDTRSLPSSAEQITSDPNAVISVSYTPSLSQCAIHTGLEFFISELELDLSSQGKIVLLSTQLVSAKSKMKAPGVSTDNLPFPRNRKKGTAGTPDNYNISVITPQALSNQPPSTKSAYFLFLEDPHFMQGDSDRSVSVMVYATEPGSPLPWWQTQLVASCRLDLPTDAQRALRLPANHRGVFWELKDGEISQPTGRVLTTGVCGVVRWKTAEMPFLSKSVESQLSTLPKLHEIMQSEDHHISRPISEQSVPEQSIPDQSIPDQSQPHEEDSDTEQDLAQLAEYKSAVVDMGRDIIALRQENNELQRRNKELSSEIARMQSSAGAADSAKALEGLPPAKLIQRITKLQQSLSTESESRRLYQNRVQSLQNALIKKNDSEVQHIQLQEAHTAQQKLVGQLQAKVAKYRRCGAICKQQESLISHLETLLAQQAQGGENTGDTVSLLTRENAQLRAAVQEYRDTEPEHKYLALREKEERIQALELQVSELTSASQELEEQVAQGVRGRNEQLEMFELEQRLAVSEARASTLMRELRESARQWAAEKAHYEIQLAELKSNALSMTDRIQHNPSELGPSLGPSEAPFPRSVPPAAARITF